MMEINPAVTAVVEAVAVAATVVDLVVLLAPMGVVEAVVVDVSPLMLVC